MTTKRLIVILALLACPCPAMGAEPALVVKAARMLDVEQGIIVQNPFVVIEKGLIKSVSTTPSSADVEMIDLGDVTLLPGLIDCHTHLALTREKDFQYTPVTMTTADFVISAVANAKKTLMAGFTTVRDVGSPDFIDVALMKASNQKAVDAPRIIPSGHWIGITAARERFDRRSRSNRAAPSSGRMGRMPFRPI